tara:strand:+ start:224 stop:685 length:462 start_codon:yes stop_codon:yes gene_type:complete
MAAIPEPKSVLSLDIGKKRVGIAGCDPLGITVTRLPALFRAKFENDLRQIRNHCKNRNVKGLVIGLPLDDKGQITSQSKHCKKYGDRLASALKLPIAWVNEHSSTWQARHKLNLHNDRSGTIDSEVAGLLLEQWLNEGPELSFPLSPQTQFED